jgi:hypothetical protein
MVTSILHRSVGKVPFFHWKGNYRGWGPTSGCPHTWSCMAPFYLHVPLPDLSDHIRTGRRIFKQIDHLSAETQNFSRGRAERAAPTALYGGAPAALYGGAPAARSRKAGPSRHVTACHIMSRTCHERVTNVSHHVTNMSRTCHEHVTSCHGCVTLCHRMSTSPHRISTC